MTVRHGTLKVSARSIVAAVAGLGLTLLGLRMLVAAGRVIGWILAAAFLALLLTPVVELLHRRMPRGLAVLVVALTMLGGAGLAGYGIGASLVRQYEGVREAVPRAAARVEASERFGDVARDAKLSERSREFVDAIPERLRGGSPAEAVRAAATRGVAFIATAILTLFFLVHGPHLLTGLVRQLPEARQQRILQIGTRAATRASRYAVLTILQAIVAGIVGYAVARALEVPGAAALGLWLTLWAVVPLVGSFVGALPIVAIAAAQDPLDGAAAALFFIMYQIAEGTLSQPEIDRRTMRLGPFLTTLAGAAGLELYGLGGALGLTLALAVVVAALAEIAAQRAEEPGAADAPPEAASPEAATGEVASPGPGAGPAPPRDGVPALEPGGAAAPPGAGVPALGPGAEPVRLAQEPPVEEVPVEGRPAEA